MPANKKYKHLYALTKEYTSKSKSYSKSLNAFRNQISAIQKQMDNLIRPDFDNYLYELAKQILPKLKKVVHYEICGYHGINERRSIHFKNAKGLVIYFISFELDQNNYKLIKFNTDKKISITDKMTISWLVSFIKNNGTTVHFSSFYK